MPLLNITGEKTSTEGTPVPLLITLPTASLPSPTSGTDKPLKMAWLTSRSEAWRQRETGKALVGPSLLSVDLGEGRKIGWLHPSFSNRLIHPHPEMFWICTNATKTQTHISVYCALFICSEYNKRTLFLCCTVFVTEWLSCSSDETGSFHVDSCCADCVKYFEKVNSRWRNSCQQI